ncbi:MAG: CapA family protein [Fibromonadaceae bacterium]|nr:CapA family protein [Fibromonadaceae bacterium]
MQQIFILLFFVLVSQVFAGDSQKLRIIFAGDLMGHLTQINAAQREAKGKGYNYKPVYKHLKPYISSADIAVINLEHTLAGPPYAGYPQFSSPDESIFAAQYAGFNVIATSNNHSLDRGKQGLERTLSVLDSVGLRHFGMYRDTVEKDSSYPLIIEKNGMKIAFLNYTYGTNELVEEAPNVVNRIDTALIAADIRRARLEFPDFIVAFMHWGPEYEIKESAAQRELAQFMAWKGVSLIVGSHPHVVQPYSKIFVPGSKDSVPVIYSLGNFFSNQRDRYRDGGIIFEINLEKTGNKTSIVSQSYLPFWVYRFDRNGNVFRLLPECKTAPGCEEYRMKPADKKAMDLFFSDTKRILPNLPRRTRF